MAEHNKLEVIAPLLKLAAWIVKHKVNTSWVCIDIRAKSLCGMMLTTISYKDGVGNQIPIAVDVKWCELIGDLIKKLSSTEKSLKKMFFKLLPSGKFDFKVYN